jgi:hypothetical protein
MSEYSCEDRQNARKVLGFKDEDGQHIPLGERSREELLDTIAAMSAANRDRITALQGANEALLKRLKIHRKAKALANRRADHAVAMMRDMLDRFEKDTPND